MRAFAVIATVLVAAGFAAAQSPSAAPSCSYTCPSSDTAYNDLVSSASEPYEIVCTYDGYGTCTYDSNTGALDSDDDSYNCPSHAHHSCGYKKRFNVVRALAARRAAAQPATSIPDVLKKRATLKRKRTTT
ncbi:hypothetical protein EXIGLDRAFT_720401 [Exidia glandulosa HHB12029]|uniref:Uncharacterized protein n=1 Tax=Exidia glandulosa HHB12029 TaxID=1314781 RepID=A0A165NI02_EXIGL|nr:hypothetical protein EXIGLDRAFT_720401 [Exidia glandulosa HHB12029]